MKIICLSVVTLSLSACAAQHKIPEEQDFKPYIANQQQVVSDAYPAASWAYPAGTPTRAIVQRWSDAGLVKGVRDTRNGTQVTVGPQFYSLSWSEQRGLANLIAQLYNAQHYMLVDSLTHKVIGTYTPTGLHEY